MHNSLILTRDLPVDDDHTVDKNRAQIVLGGEDGEDIDVPPEVHIAEDGQAGGAAGGVREGGRSG